MVLVFVGDTTFDFEVCGFELAIHSFVAFWVTALGPMNSDDEELAIGKTISV